MSSLDRARRTTAQFKRSAEKTQEQRASRREIDDVVAAHYDVSENETEDQGFVWFTDDKQAKPSPRRS